MTTILTKTVTNCFFQPRFQLKQCRHKHCHNKEWRPLTDFYKFNSHHPTAKPKLYADGYDFYCKECRRKYQNLKNKSQTWTEAIAYWKKLNDDPRNQRLDALMNGFANFDIHITPTPKVTYVYLTNIHKAKWPTYVNAFNYLYAYKFLAIPTPETLEDTMSADFSADILDKPLIDSRLLTLDDIPVGMHAVNKTISSIKSTIRFFNAFRQCSQCGEIKQTYRNPLPTLEDEPLTDEYYVQTIYLSQIKQLQHIRSLHFERSYNSLSGWKSRCIECSTKSNHHKPNRKFSK